MATFGPRIDLTALAVLALLAEAPSHPYGMQQLIRQRHMSFASGPPRRLYHAVDKLTADGLITTAGVHRDGKRPERTVYEITATGYEQLATWLFSLVAEPDREPPGFTAALSFLIYLPRETALAALTERDVALRQSIASAELTLTAVRSLMPPLLVLELDHELTMLWAEQNWVATLLTRLTTNEYDWSAALASAAALSKSPEDDP